MSKLYALWIIYERPKDYPDGFIARRWMFKNDASSDYPRFPTEATIKAPCVEMLNKNFLERGLCYQPRDDEWSSHIVCAWYEPLPDELPAN